MPKRSSKKRPDEDDPNVTAFNVVQQATAEDEPETAPEKNPAAVALGRLGGLQGGKARAKALTPERRSEIARKAASKRWSNEERKKGTDT